MNSSISSIVKGPQVLVHFTVRVQNREALWVYLDKQMQDQHLNLEVLSLHTKDKDEIHKSNPKSILMYGKNVGDSQNLTWDK